MYVWKTVKVFISSTFKDLELERDAIVHIFRSLQEKFYAKKIALIPYDLRWRQRHEEEDLVKWCVEKTEECQYFIGILGHRYGWRPPRNYLGNKNTENYSITEMEIRHSLDVIPKENRFYFLDERKWTAQDVEETEEDLHSLENLKNYLSKKENVFCYTNGKDILPKIHTQLEKYLERDYPQKVEFQITSLHEARQEIIEEKTKGFVGREKYLQELRDFVRRDDSLNYLCICAVAGTGKSSLAAYFIREVVEKKEFAIVWHYMSMGGGNSAESDKILGSIYEQLEMLGVMEQKEERDDLRSEIVDALEKTTQKIVIVLDGLDELQGKALQLHWLPKNLPNHVRVILTTRPVDPWSRLTKMKQLTSIQLPPLEKNEIEKLILYYEKTYQLELERAEKKALQERASGSPLFLKVAFDEILSHGIAIGQLAENVDKLFAQILERLEKKYGQELIEKYLGVIAASRSGITENEMNEILAFESKTEVGDDLVLIIHKSLANFIVRRNYLYNFFHPEFERTIKMRLGKGKLRTYHQLLARYLEQKGFSYERTTYELPYQMQWGEEYESLTKLLSSHLFLEAKSSMVEDLARDLERALFELAVPIPPKIKVTNEFGLIADKSLLRDIYQSIQLHLPFLRRRSQCLFQCVWNLGYWTDKNHLIHPFVEKWREKKEKESHIWLKSLKPPQNLLHSPLEKNLRFHFGSIYDVVFSPSGETMISTGGLYDMKIRMWNPHNGECFQVLQGHKAAVVKARYTTDENYIISASRDTTIKVWDIKTGECIRTLETGDEKLESLDVCDKYFAFSNRDHSIQLWSLETWECIKKMEGHNDWVKSLAFDKTGERIASASKDASIRIWDIASGKETQCFTHDMEVWCVVFHPRENTIISSSRDRSVRVWDIDKKKSRLTLLGHTTKGVNSVAISPCGKWIASGGDDRLIHIWNYENGDCLNVLDGHQSSLSCVDFAPKENKLVSCSQDKSVCLWNLDYKNIVRSTEEHTDKVSQIKWYKNKIFSCSWEVKVWDDSGNLLQTFSEPKGKINAIDYGEKSGVIVAVGNDRKIYIWHPNQNIPQILSGHKTGITNVCLNSEESQILSCSRDKTIKLWDLKESACIQTYSGHTDWVQKAIFHPDGKHIASCSKDNTVCIWNKQTGECLQTLSEHQKWVRDIDYSYDGKYIVSCSEDRKVRIWDSKTGECLKILKEHKRNVQNVKFSADAKQVVSWSWEGILLIWDVETGKRIKRMRGKSNIDHVLDKTSYLALSSSLQTVIVERESDNIVAWLPQSIDFIAINENNIMFGSMGSGYLPMFKLEGV